MDETELFSSWKRDWMKRSKRKMIIMLKLYLNYSLSCRIQVKAIGRPALENKNN